jgi:hypothetical protein
MFVFVFLCCVVCVGRGLCDGLITRPNEYACLNNKDYEASNKKAKEGPIRAVAP